MEDTAMQLREMLKTAGWSSKEIPIRNCSAKGGCVKGFKIYAVKGERSIQVENVILEAGLRQLCNMLGLK